MYKRQNFAFPEKQEKKGLTLENILNIPQGVKNQVDWPLSPQALEMITYIPEGGSSKDVPYEHLAPRFKKIRAVSYTHLFSSGKSFTDQNQKKSGTNYLRRHWQMKER